jgi:hypothetical protein
LRPCACWINSGTHSLASPTVMSTLRAMHLS